ncbi:MAG TPA: hypothetical protein PKY56_13200 [Candidatus Kapabacteria bacterium]|nr:hypothetical protein [Candidatus Kapabacteria bacterium]HPO63475.1 hypothetical protein [Candidatus Kapabacteria bacterium]
MKSKNQADDDTYANMSDSERLYKEIMIKEIKKRIASRIENDDPIVSTTLKSMITDSPSESKKK